jgi:Contractile injection system tube protein/LysM domain
VPPSTRESVLKASISILEPKAGGSMNELDHIEFPFNPKEWSITHGAEWKTETTKKGTPPPEFKGPKPATASVEIFLDESDRDGGDISSTVNRLRTLVAPDPASVTGNKPSAPHVLFEWGEAIRFKGYVESVAVKYTMFRGQGTPIRGTVTVAMKEFPEATARQNPTSGSVPGHRTHRVVAGDSLASIAYREYGDPNGWRRLAEANGIDDPLRVRDGAVLHVPPA